MTFDEYLIKKRINRAAFEAGEPARYVAWQPDDFCIFVEGMPVFLV